MKYKTYDELVDLANIFNLEYINEVIKKNYPDKPLIGEEC
ncbi:3'-phosphoadenosine 5'-phosphosulfate (PAPS) 3'-phosphatase [Virgibacillus halotolerans]|nr:3'-phosphoadenosine 5'-phosphosulfate (PAPS) 3'-phosphatase [Virgibacillus halotolerans]